MASPRKILLGIFLLAAAAGAGVYAFYFYKNNHSISWPFLPSPNQQETREMLYKKLRGVNYFNECLDVAERVIKTGPICAPNPSGQIDCQNLNLFYTDYIADCLSSLAVKQKSDEYCREMEWLKIACARQRELIIEKDRQNLPDCPKQIIDKCLLSYLAKAPPFSKIAFACGYFQDSVQQDRCWGLTAAIQNNPELCSNINSQPKRAECFHLFAFKSHQSVFCRDGDAEQNKACLDALKILPQNDPGICALGRLVYNSTSSVQCYLVMAVYNQDRSLCQKYQAANPLIDNICERYIP